MNRVEIHEIEGVELINVAHKSDERGFFSKFYEGDNPKNPMDEFDLTSLALSGNTAKGTLRGLHFQSHPFQEAKMLSCISGKTFDVIVDLRPRSLTLGKWASSELDEAIPRILKLPKGIAHGFQTLEPNTKILYALSSAYSQDHAQTLDYQDKTLEIAWPAAVSKVSERDSKGLTLEAAIAIASRGH